jgi:hypothetical protein
MNNAADRQRPSELNSAAPVSLVPDSQTGHAIESTWRELWRTAWIAWQQSPQLDATTSEWQLPRIAAFVFVAAAAVGFVRLLGGLIGTYLLRRQSRPIDDAKLTDLLHLLTVELGCPRRVAVAESNRLSTAATIGWHGRYCCCRTVGDIGTRVSYEPCWHTS